MKKKRSKHWREFAKEQEAMDPSKRPYEIKGDYPGMTLEMFKEKYHRVIEGDPRPAPFCTDANPFEDNPFLLYKGKYKLAGIVHARTTFPFEENGANPSISTVAGAPAENFVYKFVNGKLYEVVIFVKHSDYGQVFEALEAKFGKPNLTRHEVYHNAFGAEFDGDVSIWSNEVSDLGITERAGEIDMSCLILSHKELTSLAKKQTREKLKDDL